MGHNGSTLFYSPVPHAHNMCLLIAITEPIILTVLS